MSVEYYRSDDPMENFVLGIVIQELVNETEDSNAIQQPKKICANLRWQQKVFSPSEIADYLRNKHNRSVGSPVDFENRLALTRQEKEGTDHRLALQDEVLFYTLVDRDIRGREMAKESLFSRPEELDNDESSSSHRNDKFTTTHSSLHYQQQRDRQQKYLPTPHYRRMQLCFATDILLKPLLMQETVGRSDTGTQLGRRHNSHATSRDQGGVSSQAVAFSAQQYDRFYEEHVLCEVTVYEDGVIQLSPALSKPVAEPIASTANLDSTTISDTPNAKSKKNTNSSTSTYKNGQTDALALSALLDNASLSLFLDDQTCENALRHGFLLGTRKIRAKHSGRVFQIALFNQRAVWSPLLLEMRRNDSMLRDSLSAAARRPHLPMILPPAISAAAAPPTSETILRQEVFLLELVDLVSFDFDDLCLSYDILLPDNYTLYNPSVDNEINTNINGVSTNSSLRVVSRGYTHVARVSRNNPVNVVTHSFLFVPLFLCIAMMSCIAVAVGVSWLLWLCPVLCIVIFHFIRVSGKPCEITTRAACLNHCVSLKCIVASGGDTIFDNKDKVVLGEVRVSVYSKAIFDRGVLIGVASFPLHVQGGAQGSNIEDVPVLSLQGGIESQLRHFFLGQSVALKQNATHSFFNSVSDKSRFGSLTSFAGILRVRRSRLSYTNKINQTSSQNQRNVGNKDAGGSLTPSVSSGSATPLKRGLSTALTSAESGSDALKQLQQLRREQSQRISNLSSSAKLTDISNDQDKTKNKKDVNKSEAKDVTNSAIENNFNSNYSEGGQRPSVRSILDSLGSASKRPSISNTTTLLQNETTTPRETPRLTQRSRANSSLTNNTANFSPQQSPKVDLTKVSDDTGTADSETVNNTIINSARRFSPRPPSMQNPDNTNTSSKPAETEAKSETPVTRKRIPLRSRYNSFKNTNNTNGTNDEEEEGAVTGNSNGVSNATITSSQTDVSSRNNDTAIQGTNQSPRLHRDTAEEDELEIAIIRK